MSQMGRVIQAVNKLFRQRDEIALAYQRYPPLFHAAKAFKVAIDDFEQRVKEKKKNG